MIKKSCHLFPAEVIMAIGTHMMHCVYGVIPLMYNCCYLFGAVS